MPKTCQINVKQKKDRQQKDKQEKDGRTHNDLQTITENNKDRATRNPLKTRMLRKGKKFLLHMWHPSLAFVGYFSIFCINIQEKVLKFQYLSKKLFQRYRPFD
jgi:hypothetical protein